MSLFSVHYWIICSIVYWKTVDGTLNDRQPAVVHSSHICFDETCFSITVSIFFLNGVSLFLSILGDQFDFTLF